MPISEERARFLLSAKLNEIGLRTLAAFVMRDHGCSIPIAPVIATIIEANEQGACLQREKESDLREALEWALAEIDGRTRYDREEQRENARACADAALCPQENNHAG